MISVIIPTLDAEERFAACLTALVPAVVEGVIREVFVVDGGSTDHTLKIADQAGVDVMTSEPGRGAQLVAGARRARQPWLLFLHADSVLSAGWHDEASDFMERIDQGRLPAAAATFRFALDDYGMAPRVMEKLVAFRGAAMALPFGDQGLLIPRRLYDEIGGFKAIPLMEDVDIVRRLGRKRLRRLRASAVTGATRYRNAGYARRVLRNQTCFWLYMAGMSPSRLVEIYDHEREPTAVRPAPAATVGVGRGSGAGPG
jgi:rSAM/selenodomain-associated transferase 2